MKGKDEYGVNSMKCSFIIPLEVVKMHLTLLSSIAKVQQYIFQSHLIGDLGIRASLCHLLYYFLHFNG